jgi:UDP-N-acetylglucosamine/UDP-N-acetylgalactosamine diphosphorylase
LVADPSELESGSDELRAQLARVGQDHLLTFYDELSPCQKAHLIGDIRRLPTSDLPALVEHGVLHDPEGRLAPDESLSPVQATPMVGDRADRGQLAGAFAAAQEALRQGQVAALTVAGGQGTRLGLDGPKGAYPIGPVSGHSLFRIFADQLRFAQRQCGRPMHWYIMTSPQNHQATAGYFEANDWMGLDPSHVHLFAQAELPCFSKDGLVLLANRDRIAFSPDGHGGLFEALARSGLLESMQREGVRTLSCFQVDNPMVRCIDPVFLGMHLTAHAQVSCKALPKAHDREGLGNFCLRQGKLHVIEYSELPDRLARARNPDGSRTYSAGSISIYALSVDFVRRIASQPSALRYHRAAKAVSHVDLATGALVEPSEPNAIKLEKFLFDALPHAARALVVETVREEEFAPVKNLTGPDSVASCRRAMVQRAAGWLQRAGVAVPCAQDGCAQVVVEISPLLACDGEQLAQAIAPDTKLDPGCHRYLK